VHVLINNVGRGMRLISETFNTFPTKFWHADVAA
jgi:3-oxoacyl-[acyl-carrier protein] reductase